MAIAIRMGRKLSFTFYIRKEWFQKHTEELSQSFTSSIFSAQSLPPSNSSGSCRDLRAHQACTAPAALRNEVGAFAQLGMVNPSLN
jgi:hypothetical protein